MKFQGHLPAADAVKVLRFIAGVEHQFNFELLERGDFPDYLETHRVLGRLLNLLGDAFDPHYSGVIEDLRARQAATVEKFQLKQQKIEQFIQQFAQDLSTIAVKFQLGYDLSKQTSAIRFSSDVDLVVQEHTVLLRRLESAGISVPHARQPSHEFANAIFEGLKIDLHRYFPCWEVNSSPTVYHANAGNIREESDQIYEHCLSYLDLDPSARFFDGIKVPSVVDCAVISIAAAYRDYLYHGRVLLYQKPSLLMSNILEITDAFNNREFNWDRFLTALRSARSLAAASWVGWILKDLLDDDRLSNLLSQYDLPELHGRVRRCVGGGFLVPFSEIPSNLISRRLGTDELLGVLCRSDLVTTQTLEIDLSCSSPDGSYHQSVIGSTSLAGHRIRIETSADSIVFELPIGAEISDKCRIYFECNDEMLEWHRDTKTGDYNNLTRASATLRERLRSFRTSNNGNVVITLDRRGWPARLPIVVTVGDPLLPSNAVRGWLCAFALRL